MDNLPNAFDKAREFVSFERLTDARFVLTFANFALFADVVLGRIYDKSLLSVTYTWGEQLPVGALAAALITYGAVSAFAAPLLRFAFQRLVVPFIPYSIWAWLNPFPSSRDAMPYRDLGRIGLLTDRAGLVARAAQVQRAGDEMDRVLSDILVFGTLLLTTQFVVPTSLVAALLRSVHGEWHMPLAWLLAALGGLAVLYGFVSSPEGNSYVYLNEADQRLLYDSVPGSPSVTATPAKSVTRSG